MNVEAVIGRLEALADPAKVKLKQEKFGIIANNALGVYQKDLKVLAKEIGADNELAVALFNTGIYEARILCSKLFNPADLSEALMESWVKTFENWEVCDSFSMGLFAKSPHARTKIFEWSSRPREFEKRSAFATIAAYCMADKKAENAVFESFLPLIQREAVDERIYVKKAVNWALRNIGKHNVDLNRAAIITARALVQSGDQSDNKAEKWVGNNALKELENPDANILDYPRAIYRKGTK